MEQKGFSLIELLVVITILGILAAIGLTSYRTANMKARDSRRQADIQQMRSALEMWRTDCGEYPNSGWSGLMSGNHVCPLSGGTVSFVDTYLGGRPLIDPRDEAPYVYTYSFGGATTYTITYNLEVDGSTVTVRNP